MAKIKLSLLSANFIALSIVNDAIIIGDNPLFSWSKLLFIVATLILLTRSFSLKMPNYVDLFVFIFCTTCIIFTVSFSDAGVGPRFYSIATSLIIGLLSFLLISRSILEFDELRRVFVFWVIASTLLSIIQSFFGFGFLSDRIFLSTFLPGLYRASGMMSDPNYFALVCLLGLAFSLNDSKSKQLLCFIGLLLSGSRSGLIIAAILFSISLNKSKINHFLIVKYVVILFFVFLLAYMSRGWLPSSLSMVFDFNSYFDPSQRNSLSDRTVAIYSALEAFKGNMLFGYGIGNLVFHPSNVHAQMSHNTIIEVLSENGIVGLFLYFMLNFSLYLYIVNNKSMNYKDRKFLLISFFIFHFMSMTIVVHYSRIYFFFIGLILLSGKVNLGKNVRS